MTHRTISRLGGRARSPAKTAANRAKAAAYWEAVRAGRLPAPRRSRVPPPPEVVGRMLAEYAKSVGISKLEIFGSTARGEARRGSDVDLIASFSNNPGLEFFGMEEEMTKILGVPAHLITRDGIEAITSESNRNSILRDARVIYVAPPA